MTEKQNKQHEAVVGIRVVLREFKKDPLAIISLIVLSLIMIFVIVAPLFIDQTAVMEVNPIYQYAKPGTRGFILGADEGGREILYQLIIGARNSIFIGVGVTILTSLIGLTVGTISGYFGGRVDNTIMRICDFISILPRLMLIIALIQVVRTYNAVNLTLIISMFDWIGMARLFRSRALSEASLDYIQASKTLGSGNVKIILRELLPNMSSLIIVNLTLAFAGNIGIETGLSFLGFGLPSTTPSLGTLIGYATSSDIIKNKMWVWLPAALLILIMMLAINYIGQALQRSADSKQRLG